MSPGTKKILDTVASWPAEDQEELAEVAREIEARRTGVYMLSDEERTAIDEGLNQLNHGQFVPEKEMAVFWKKFGVV